MPSKHGFGNSRTPMAKKVSYGSAMHYKNPILKAGCGPGDECAGNFKVNKKGTKFSRWAKSTLNRFKSNTKNKKSNKTKPKDYYDSGSHKTVRYL